MVLRRLYGRYIWQRKHEGQLGTGELVGST